MDTTEDFTARLRRLTATDILRVAAAVRSELDTADGEIAWWRATIEVTASLRRHRCAREAGLAAHRAATAVQAAAVAAGLGGDDHRSDVTAVARAAAEVARVRVLEACAELPHGSAAPLLHPWQPVAAA